MNKVKKISHHESFRIVKGMYPDKDVRFSSHLPMGLPGGLSMLENATLFALMKIVNPENIFEFGTYLGASSVLLAENSKPEAKVITLDLESQLIDQIDPTNLDLTEKEQNDDFLRQSYKEKGAVYIKKASPEVKKKIKCITGDSVLLDPEKKDFIDMFDFIFIDGGHNREIIKIDTANAERMISKDGIIAWHDYNSNVHTDVTDYLNEVSEFKDSIYHVDNTMIAFYPIGKYKQIFESL